MSLQEEEVPGPDVGSEPEAPDVHESILGLLIESYGLLGQAWRDALAVQECADDAPWNTCRELTDMGGPGDTIISFGENAAVLSGQAVRQHIGILTRAYGSDPEVPDGGPEAHRWPHAAVYAPARAIAEGTALVGWLLDPGPGRAERVQRAARFALWSSPGHWTDIIETAGLTVGVDDNGTPMLASGEGARPLSPGALVKAVHGGRAQSKNSKWSKLLHNDPGLLAPLASIRFDRGGAHIGSQIREDQHLALALDLTELIRRAGARQTAYWGRSAGSLPEACDRVRDSISPVLPDVELYVQVRARALFE
ncbi:hypothetical protein [Pseudonocardia kunmingensis]|uniref:Uncharacterized protein n=1 Tax=Pseudonocardia kunmingensis TaxID=630975 RepID=A0A543DKC2_9PSEU|nr:hypothetical protein [Pseudonocardia kunmingensis]TQM09787.1 hypothetical protein FB558_5560 [Pseudonocardia kunmingensis]